MRPRQNRCTCAVILWALFIAPWAHAEERKWVGRSPFNDNVSDVANWDGFRLPATWDTAVFPPAAVRTWPNINIDFELSAVEFTDDVLFRAPAYIIKGSSTLTITQGIFNRSTTAQTINAPIKLGDPFVSFFNTRNTGRLTIGGPVNTNGNRLTVNTGEAGAQIDGVISGGGALRKGTTGGWLDLTAKNTYTGETVVESGTLRLTSTGRLSDRTNLTVAAGAAFETVGASHALASINGDGRITLSSNASLVTNGGSFRGVIDGNGRLTKRGAGTLALSGASTYTGDTNVEQGRLQLSGAGRLSDATDVTVSGGAIFEMVGTTDAVNSLNGAGRVTLLSEASLVTHGGSFTGIIDGDGGVTKRGAGTLSLSGNNTYSGITVIEGGELTVNRAASPATGWGVWVKSGLYTMTGSPGVYAPASLDISGLGAARLTPGSDKLLRTRSVSTFDAGKLDLADNYLVLHGVTLERNMVFIGRARNGGSAGLWTGPGISSSSAAASPAHSLGVILNDDGAGQPLYASFHGATGLTATNILVAYTLTGDANLDGRVTFADFQRLERGFGATASAFWSDGDFNYDRKIDFNDFLLLRANFGASTAPPSEVLALSQFAEAHFTPEPGTLLLILASFSAALQRTPRRSCPLNSTE